MGRKANPTIIGAFVVGAIALIVGALLLIGSGRLFKTTIPFVIFFPGSVNGLNVGASVKLKGVPIGEVTKIRLSVEEARREEYRIPVFIELDPDTMIASGARLRPMDLRDRSVLRDLFKNGLRAQLQAESLVTGVLYVALDVFPADSPLTLYLPEDSDLLEIPALPTPLEQATSAFRQILDKIDKVDFKGILDNLEQTVSGINHLVNSPEIENVLTQLDTTLASVDQAANGIRDLSHTANETVGSLDVRLNTAVAELSKALVQADTTLREATTTFHSVSNLVEPGSRLTDQLGRTLEDLGEASRAVRRLADTLESNPSTLLYGRGTEDD
jgi:paraquat-inducible protein B